MDAPRRTAHDDRSEPYSEDSILACHRRVTRACAFAGLSAADADDVAQDLWAWLLRTGLPMTVITTPWLKAAAQNYILRFRRRAHLRNVREGRSLDSLPEPQSIPFPPQLESNELLDQVAAVLPKTERCLLDLVRRGHTIAEASRMLGIPRGSRDYHKGQLIAYARRELQRRNRIPISKG